MGSCLYRLTEARSEACPQCTNDCANTRAELLSLRVSFFCGVCCSFCFVGDSPQRLLSTIHHMVGRCYKIATMKGPAVWYHQTKVCQSGYAHTAHLSTSVAVMACQHCPCCVLAATQAQGLGNVASLSLPLLQSLKSLSTFCEKQPCVMPHQEQTAKLNVKTGRIF